MSQMPLSQVRVVDPVLSTIAQGYSQPGLVGNLLFPQVPVDLSGGQVLQFGKEAFQLYSTARAPGGTIPRIQFGYAGKPYALENHALAGVLPVEMQRDALAYPGIDLSKTAISQPMDSIQLTLEVAQATLATNAANYDANHKIALAAGSKWSDPGSNPVSQINGYMEAIRASTGRLPNVKVFGPAAWNAFRNNPAVMDRIKYTQRGLITEDLAAALLGIEKVVVGRAVVADSQGNFSDVWGNNSVLAYTALGSMTNAQPSYAYTYVMRGHPIAEQPWYDNNAKSWIFPVSYERVPVLTGITAGYLVQTPA